MQAKVKVAAIQMSMSEDKNSNVIKAEKLVREAAADGANIAMCIFISFFNILK